MGDISYITKKMSKEITELFCMSYLFKAISTLFYTEIEILTCREAKGFRIISFGFFIHIEYYKHFIQYQIFLKLDKLFEEY